MAAFASRDKSSEIFLEDYFLLLEIEIEVLCPSSLSSPLFLSFYLFPSLLQLLPFLDEKITPRENFPLIVFSRVQLHYMVGKGFVQLVICQVLFPKYSLIYPWKLKVVARWQVWFDIQFLTLSSLPQWHIFVQTNWSHNYDFPLFSTRQSCFAPKTTIEGWRTFLIWPARLVN